MTEQLSQADYQKLKKAGYTDAQINEALKDIDLEEQGYGYESQASPFYHSPTDNLVKWQLELNDILDKAHHILREDLVTIDKDGEVKWKENPNPFNRLLSDYGVDEIMRILSVYVNRNTILSDYSPEEIDYKVFDFGKEVNDLIFMKYEKIFRFPTIDECLEVFKKNEEIEKRTIQRIYSEVFNETIDEQTLKDAAKVKGGKDEIMKELNRIRNELMLEKRKNYPMLLREMIDLVHSSYKRATFGGERRTLREARQVTQTEAINPQTMSYSQGVMQSPEPQKRGILNPMRYVGGKYK